MNVAQPISSLLELIEERRTFFVTSHCRPDGDAIGSSLGMMHLLEGLGKQVTVGFADPIPHIYRSLPGAERIVSALPCAPPDATILLECDSLDRSGFTQAEFDDLAAPCTINIDHHVSGRPYAHFNWIDVKACAVGAMVYDLAVASGVEITPAMATCLYTAVLTDTGSFTYAGTVASTFALAEHLVQRGADANRIAQDVYFSNSASKFRLLGAALRTLQVEPPIACAWITLEDMESAGASFEDSEGIVNYLIAIAGIEMAVFLREMPGGQFRLSLRSKQDIDVAAVAEMFGGGGHRNSSGCTITGPLDSVRSRILEQLREQSLLA